jgi:hypothetical protein
MKNHEIHEIPNFANITVREMSIEKMGYKELLYFWFQTKNRVSYDVNINWYHLAVHAIMRDNTCDLFIRPITLLDSSGTIEDAEKRMDQFVS